MFMDGVSQGVARSALYPGLLSCRTYGALARRAARELGTKSSADPSRVGETMFVTRDPKVSREARFTLGYCHVAPTALWLDAVRASLVQKAAPTHRGSAERIFVGDLIPRCRAKRALPWATFMSHLRRVDSTRYARAGYKKQRRPIEGRRKEFCEGRDPKVSREARFTLGYCHVAPTAR
jgi:hypothetical protein